VTRLPCGNAAAGLKGDRLSDSLPNKIISEGSGQARASFDAHQFVQFGAIHTHYLLASVSRSHRANSGSAGTAGVALRRTVVGAGAGMAKSNSFSRRTRAIAGA
jgi:hypothetical protein